MLPHAKSWSHGVVDPGDVGSGVVDVLPSAYSPQEKAQLLMNLDGESDDPVDPLPMAISTAAVAKIALSQKKQPPASDAAANPNHASKILFLDGLRGLAAMLVVCQHAGYLGRPLGQPSVDTFFVLSAFLLTMIFESKAAQLLAQEASPRRWKYALIDYFARRILRVYPLFVCIAIVLTFYSDKDKGWLFRVKHPQDYSVLKVITFKTNYRFHVFWTLPLEITYYFMIPVFVLVVLKLKKLWWVPLVPIFGVIMYSGLYCFRLDHMPLLPHLPTFLCGSTAAIVHSKIKQWLIKRSFVFRWWHQLALRTVEMVSLAILLSVLFGGLFFHWVAPNPVPQTPGGAFVSVNVSIIIVCEMLLPGVVSDILEWSLLRYAGKISYSMYMMHSFVIYSETVRNQSYYDKLFSLWGLTFLLSTATFYAIEYPSQLAATKIGQAIKKRDTIERQRTMAVLPLAMSVVVDSHNHTT